MQSEVQLYTIVLHDNIILPDVIVERFLIDFDLVRGVSEVRGAQGVSGVGSLVVGLGVTCSEHYYGEFCNVLCEPRNDSHGHYICDSEGNIVCLSGFMDPLNFCNTTCPVGMCKLCILLFIVITVVLVLHVCM